MVTARRPTKAEARRARAEAARAAVERAQRRSRNIRLASWSAGAAAVVVAVAVAIVVLNKPAHSPATTAAPPPSTAGTLARTSTPPWDMPDDASAAVAAAGLPMLGEEGTALHIHAHLDVIANGAAVQVPSDIGVDDAHHKISPLHSHDTTGVIHIESPDKSATFTLGQFFKEWEVSLSTDHVGGLTADATHHLNVYVNGTVHAGDPNAIVLAAHDEIAIVYGTDAQQTNVPNMYQWTNGL
jgi:hypothetical protein